jgi:UDP-N-acetyl-D-glucosamine dehydrogenase
MPHYVIELLADGLNTRGKCLKGARLLILGVAYKREVGDMRESPALDVIRELQRKGAAVQYADPFVPTLVHEGLEVERVELNAETIRRCDAVVILTDHRQFDYQMVVQTADLVVDARNATRGLSAPEGKIIRL